MTVSSLAAVSRARQSVSQHSPIKLRKKPSEHTYLDTRVINSHRNKSKTPFSDAQSRLETKRHLIALADQLKEHGLKDKLQQCHSRVALLTCGSHVPQVIPNYVCEFRLCPHCARRRARKHQNNYLLKVETFTRSHRVTPVHLVLTQAHRDETLEESTKRLMIAFRKLGRRKFWKQHFRGGIWTMEVTKDRKGFYHTHLHLLAFRTRFFDITLLRGEWELATGDSYNLHLKPILEDVSSGLREVLKYVAKPLDIKGFNAQNLKDFLDMKNARFFGTFGEFRKFCADFEASGDVGESILSTDLTVDLKDLVEGCACPFCNEPLLEVRLGENEFPDFLRRIGASRRSKSPPT